jgi:hypothetical protein
MREISSPIQSSVLRQFTGTPYAVKHLWNLFFSVITVFGVDAC